VNSGEKIEYQIKNRFYKEEEYAFGISRYSRSWRNEPYLSFLEEDSND